jgi:hypothetical protein
MFNSPNILGFTPAYSREKTGMRAPIMASAESASAPTIARLETFQDFKRVRLTEAYGHDSQNLSPMGQIQRV